MPDTNSLLSANSGDCQQSTIYLQDHDGTDPEAMGLSDWHANMDLMASYDQQGKIYQGLGYMLNGPGAMRPGDEGLQEEEQDYIWVVADEVPGPDAVVEAAQEGWDFGVAQWWTGLASLAGAAPSVSELFWN